MKKPFVMPEKVEEPPKCSKCERVSGRTVRLTPRWNNCQPCELERMSEYFKEHFELLFSKIRQGIMENEVWVEQVMAVHTPS